VFNVHYSCSEEYAKNLARRFRRKVLRRFCAVYKSCGVSPIHKEASPPPTELDGRENRHADIASMLAEHLANLIGQTYCTVVAKSTTADFFEYHSTHCTTRINQRRFAVFMKRTPWIAISIPKLEQKAQARAIALSADVVDILSLLLSQK